MTTPKYNSGKLLSDSFEALFFHYSKGLVVYARNFVPNMHDAEDIVHDVFMNLWEKWDTISADTVGAYLFRSTRNRCLDHISYSKVRSRYQKDVINGIQEENTKYYIQSELRQFLDNMISELPPQQRKAFVMRKFEDKSTEEISAALNLSPNTVNKHIQLATRKIKLKMSDYLYLLMFFNLHN